MDKRIKTVWALSILTMLFITCGQTEQSVQRLRRHYRTRTKNTAGWKLQTSSKAGENGR